MDFQFTPRQQEFRRQLRSWLEDHLPEDWKGSRRSLPRDPEQRKTFLLNWQRELHEGGWVGIRWPEEYGGRGAGLMEQVIHNQEMARAGAPPVINVAGVLFVGPSLIRLGTEEQKQRFIPNILSADEIWCQGYSEPSAGSDLAGVETFAEDRGDRYVINGQKIWTSFAHYADWCLLLARTDRTGGKHQGLTLMMVDMDQDGVSTEPIHQINDRREFNQTYFDDAVARKDHVIGNPGEGWSVALTVLNFERHGFRPMYELERKFKRLVELHRAASTRRDRPPRSDRLADLFIRVRAAKLTFYRNLSRELETGEPGPESSMNKLLASELNQDLEEFATSLEGVRAGLWGEQPAGAEVEGRQTAWLRSMANTIEGGTSEIQRNVLAERSLGLPKDVKE